MANGHIRRHATLYRTQKWVWTLVIFTRFDKSSIHFVQS